MTRRDAQARLAGAARYTLGEGIILDDRTGVARWVDIDEGAVHAGTVGRDAIAETEAIRIEGTAGAVALTADGGLLVAAARGLATIAPDATVSYGPELISTGRFNDGSVDPQGRFVVGSLTEGETSDHEVLLRVSPDGSVETLRSGLTLSNGIGWSPDGATIYHVDTFTKTLAAHPYDSDSWDEWTLIPCEFAGYPDGLTVDTDGHLWIAQWGAGVVQRFATTGELIETISVPTASVSCAGFVGDGLLAITTSVQDTEGDPLAGALFICEVDASGLPESRWLGSTTTPYWREQ